VALAPGARLGSYEVVAPIGAGGMGEVYRARDTRLKRDVAIKVLPESFAQDPDRLARFRREAELLASLSHANIAAIYGLEQADGMTALVLELIEGETLAEQIARGPLPTGEAMPIVRQLVDALEAAHEKGVIHRDLKPANIKITPDGAVKVLDFGLAKLAPIEVESVQAGGMNALSMSPTLSIHATYAGVILGTAAYMSPEQAKGRTVDKRSDVWAFGCVLFETLTGRRPFEGEDVADTIAFVLTKEPDWSLLPAHVPPAIRLLLRRCLEKDRKRRIADISTVRFVLDEPTSVSAEPVAAAATGATPPTPRWRRLATYAAILAAGVPVAAAGAWMVTRANERALQVSRFTIVPAAAQALNTNAPDRAVTISPDGSHIVYRGGAGNAGAGQMFVRAIDQLEARPVAGISGFRDPFISPDSRWIGFFALNELRKVSITGGPSILLCRPQGGPRGASWGPDDTIIFATGDTNTGLMSVPAAGGEPKVLTKPDPAHGEADHAFPFILPGGAAVLFTITASQLENSQVAVLDLKTGERKILIRGGSQAQYVDTGHLVYAAAGSLRAVRFDLKRLEVVSDPVPVVEQVLTTTAGEASFALSRTGTLLHVPGGVGGSEGVRRSLVWVNRQGKEEAIKAPARTYAYPRLSPDGSRLAIDVRDQENDIWVWDLARETLTRLTFDPTDDNFPVWTPDSKRIVFASTRAGIPNLYSQAADGTGIVERLTTSPNQQEPTSISHDGTRLVFFEIAPKTGPDLYLLPLQGERRSKPLIQTTFIERNADLSPESAWIAYESNESGQFQVYVRPFPNVEGGRWQVSTSGGSTRPVWARSGKELFYLNGDGVLTAVPVRIEGSTFSAGNPSKVLETKYYGVGGGNNGRTYDVSANGQRFLMIKDAPTNDQQPTTTPASMIVTLNWTEELKRLSPAK
jgi:eukaryotic-like serine/threonine-protein kinase